MKNCVYNLASIFILISIKVMGDCSFKISSNTLMSSRALLAAGIFFNLLSIQAAGQGNLYSAIEKGKNSSSIIATGWMHLLTDLLRRDAIPPSACLRMYAYTGLALYESQVPALPGYQSLFTHISGNKISGIKKQMYYSPVAANAAISELVRKLAILKSKKEIDSIESSNQIIFEQQTSQKKSEASIEYGKQIADAIFKWSKTDGTFATYSSYSIAQAPELWKPGPNAPNPPPGAYQGLLRTFVKDAVLQSLPPSPTPYSTDTASVFYKSARTVVEARNQITLSDSLLILAWQNKYGINYLTMEHLTKLLTFMLEKENYSLEQAAVIYAKNGMAMFDAIVSSLNAIYKYNIIRPFTYIQNVMGNKEWRPVYNYDHYPSYPSNYAACVAASGVIMAGAFGESYPITDSTQAFQYGLHNFTSITHFVNEVSICRVKAGIEFPFGMEAGKIQGRKIGELVNALPFKKRK